MAKAKPDYRIAWQPKACGDLRNIVQYIGKDSLARARSVGQALHAKAAPLAQHLVLGSTGRPVLPSHIRELVVHQNYIIFYRVLSDNRMVEILRAKHSAQKTP